MRNATSQDSKTKRHVEGGGGEEEENETLDRKGCRGMWDNITCWPSAKVGEMVLRQCPIYFSFFSDMHGCRGMWDNITCWPSAKVGEMVLRQCPIYFSFFSDMHGNVTRSCTKQGWADMHPVSYAVACGYDVNTSAMEETQFFGTVKIGYTVGHSLSLISLTVAMIILCVFRKLHCTRNYIHMHLFMSFILRAVAVFVKDVVLFESGESDHCFVGSCLMTASASVQCATVIALCPVTAFIYSQKKKTKRVVK
ncbi:UNVERIFIED_CONTAM: hypothetical protein FKN15_031265 [Acipenser sinensis]